MRKLLVAWLYLALLTLPSLLWAGTLTVKKDREPQQDAGMIRRTSLRGENYVVDQDSASFNRGEFTKGPFAVSISSAPISYKDSLGKWKAFNFDAVPDSVSGFTVVRTGKFDIAYDSTGRIRYQKKDALLTITPRFNRTNVDIDFNINRNGLKSQYILKNSSAPSILKWQITANDTVEEQSGGKGKGQLKKASRIMGLIAEFYAWDATGKAVPLSATYKKDSLIVTLDTAGAVYPVTIDPTVNDTALGTASAQLRADNAAEWWLSRDSINASTVNANNWSSVHPGTNNGSGGAWSTARTALTFPMQSLTVPGTVDSALIYIATDGVYPTTDSSIIYILKGTFTSPTPAAGWYKQFVGWTSGAPHTGTPLDSTHLVFLISDGSTVKSTYFNRGGLDTLKNHMGVDSLRLMLIEHFDFLFVAPGAGTNHGLVQGAAPYLKIYYNMIVPAVTTVNDSLGRALVGNITSIGSVNPTVRGVKYWPKGASLAADTVTVSDTSAGYPAGLFTIGTKTLKADTTYFFTHFAKNIGGLTWGGVDSFVTTTTATTIMIDGRAVGGIH